MKVVYLTAAAIYLIGGILTFLRLYKSRAKI